MRWKIEIFLMVIFCAAIPHAPGQGDAIPGVIQTEDYDLGGEGAAYHDSDAGNTGGTFRGDHVDIEAGTGVNGYNVGWVQTVSPAWPLPDQVDLNSGGCPDRMGQMLSCAVFRL